MVLLNHPWIILDRLVDVILSNVKGCIVEIGLGESTEVLARQAAEMNVKHYACDKRGKVCEWVTFNDNIDHKNMVLTHCSSFDFMEKFNDSPAIVFIDGDHHAEVLGIETAFFFEKMLVGGVMFLHDTCPWETTYDKKIRQGRIIDTYTIRKTIEKFKSAEVFTWPYTAGNCGLTMILKKDMKQPFYRI